MTILFCMCAVFDNASPYPRSKFSNNHRLYRDTMPLIQEPRYVANCCGHHVYHKTLPNNTAESDQEHCSYHKNNNINN